MDKLHGQYGEQAVASGTSASGQAYIEFWVSEASGTWSVLLVMPNGMTCLTSAGRDFQWLQTEEERKEFARRGQPAI